jgi:hypothetical protein
MKKYFDEISELGEKFERTISQAVDIVADMKSVTSAWIAAADAIRAKEMVGLLSGEKLEKAKDNLMPAFLSTEDKTSFDEVYENMTSSIKDLDKLMSKVSLILFEENQNHQEENHQEKEEN